MLGILLVSGLLGLWRGLVVEVMSLLSWIAAFWVALAFGDDLAPLLSRWIASPMVAASVAYVASFILTLVLGGGLTWLLARIVDRTGLSGTDRSLGFVFGVLRGIALSAVIVLVIGFTPLSQSPAWQQASLVPYILPAAQWLRSWLPDALTTPALPQLPLPAGDPSSSTT